MEEKLRVKKDRPKMIIFEEGKYYRSVSDMKRKDIKKINKN